MRADSLSHDFFRRVWGAPLAALLLMLGACSPLPPRGAIEPRDGAPERPIDVSAIPDAVPRDEPRSAYGNPPSYEVYGTRYDVLASAGGYSERGIASWYGTKFHGKRTSSGDPYDMYAMTAAHRTLPLPTYAEVINLVNGRKVIVKINDRGPFHENRIIDLSYAAATKLGILGEGTGLVEVRAIDPRAPAPASDAPAAKKNIALYLQVGAFAERANAERLRERLESLAPGEHIAVQNGTGGDKTFHRVRLGPLTDVDAVDRLAAKLSAQGITDAHVVID